MWKPVDLVDQTIHALVDAKQLEGLVSDRVVDGLQNEVLDASKLPNQRRPGIFEQNFSNLLQP
jgi:hypothetical protein